MSQKSQQRTALASLAALLAFLQNHGAHAQGAMQPQFPDFFTTSMKQLYQEIESESVSDFVEESLCTRRLNLYKELNQVSNAQAGQVRAGVLDELGFCEFAKENYEQAHRWFETALTETGIPETMLQDASVLKHNLGVMPIYLMREATQALKKKMYSAVGTNLRRLNFVFDRVYMETAKQSFMQQGMAKKNQLKGKEFDRLLAQHKPQLETTKHFTVIKQKQKMVEQLVKRIDDVANKHKRHLVAAESRYVPALLFPETKAMENGHQLLEDLKLIKLPKEAKDEKGEKKKGGVVIDPTSGEECSKDKFEDFCRLLSGEIQFENIKKAAENEKKQKKLEQEEEEALVGAMSEDEKRAHRKKKREEKKEAKKLGKKEPKPIQVPKKAREADYSADILTNIHGNTKLAKFKNKSIKIPKCNSNGSITAVYANEEFGMKLGSSTERITVSSPVMVDSCVGIELEQTSGNPHPVLIVGLWHPELTAIEKSTAVRNEIKHKDTVKKLTDRINKNSGKFEKLAKTAAKAMEEHYTSLDIRSSKKIAEDGRAGAAEEATTAESTDDGKSKEEKLKELEEKRRLKREKIAKREAERAKKAAQKKKEEKEKSPWLTTPISMKITADGETKTVDTTLEEQQQKLENLESEKRELDRMLEFAQGVDVLKLINEQRRVVTRAEKKAKKTHKKLQSGAAPKKKKDQKEGEKKDSDTPSDSAAASDSTAASSDAETTTAESSETAKEASEEDPAAAIEALEKEIEQLKKDKKEAAEKEDYGKAKELKKEIKEKEEKREKLEKKNAEKKKDPTYDYTGEQMAIDLQKLALTIETLKEEKAEAAKKEDFKQAKNLKKIIGEKEEEKEKLKKQLMDKKTEEAKAAEGKAAEAMLDAAKQAKEQEKKEDKEEL